MKAYREASLSTSLPVEIYLGRREEFFLFALLLCGDIDTEHGGEEQQRRADNGTLFWQVFEKFFGEGTWGMLTPKHTTHEPLHEFINWCRKNKLDRAD